MAASLFSDSSGSRPFVMNKNTHFLSADILRGVAITMVIVFHSFGWMVPWKGWFRDFAVAPRHMGFIGYPITLGWAGVALFFVLRKLIPQSK